MQSSTTSIAAQSSQAKFVAKRSGYSFQQERQYKFVHANHSPSEEVKHIRKVNLIRIGLEDQNTSECSILTDATEILSVGCVTPISNRNNRSPDQTAITVNPSCLSGSNASSPFLSSLISAETDDYMLRQQQQPHQHSLQVSSFLSCSSARIKPSTIRTPNRSERQIKCIKDISPIRSSAALSTSTTTAFTVNRSQLGHKTLNSSRDNSEKGKRLISKEKRIDIVQINVQPFLKSMLGESVEKAVGLGYSRIHDQKKKLKEIQEQRNVVNAQICLIQKEIIVLRGNYVKAGNKLLECKSFYHKLQSEYDQTRIQWTNVSSQLSKRKRDIEEEKQNLLETLKQLKSSNALKGEMKIETRRDRQFQRQIINQQVESCIHQEQMALQKLFQIQDQYNQLNLEKKSGNLKMLIGRNCPNSAHNQLIRI